MPRTNNGRTGALGYYRRGTARLPGRSPLGRSVPAKLVEHQFGHLAQRSTVGLGSFRRHCHWYRTRWGIAGAPAGSTGKRILLLERGGYLPRSEKNWNSQAVFVDAAYQAEETWTNSTGDTFRPALHYYVGGNSKVYGGALFRFRERDFGEVAHSGGLSPAWPSDTTSSNLIIRKQNDCFTCTASAVKILSSRGRADRTRFPP